MRGLARLVSLAAAFAVVALTVLYPRLIAVDGAHVPYLGFVLLLAGMSASWVHGFGFVPQKSVPRLLFSPWVAWPLLGLGAWLVFR